jgi:predicted Zn-dependent peptidase
VYLVKGQFDKKEVLRLFTECLAAKPDSPLVQPSCFSYKHDIIHVHCAKPSVTIRLAFPSQRTAEDNVLTELLADVLHDLLFDELRVKKHLIYNIGVNDDVDVCGGVMFFEVDVLDSQVEGTWRSMLELLNKYRTSELPGQYIKASKNEYVYQHNSVKVMTSDFIDQAMQQPTATVPKLFNRAQRLQMLKDASATDLTALYRRVCPFEKALCVYQGTKKHELKWI